MGAEIGDNPGESLPMSGIRVTVWNEGVHEKTHEEVRKVYPEGMGAQTASG